jgi:hypothetical protein
MSKANCTMCVKNNLAQFHCILLLQLGWVMLG